MMRKFLCVMLVLFTGGILFPVDYSILGEVYTSGNSDSFGTGLQTGAFLDHRFSYPDGAFGLTHEISYLPDSSDEFSHTLYTAYANLRLSDALLFTAGKFRIPWTKCVYFAPLDKINPSLQSLDTKSPREGFWGASISWTPDQDTSLILCADVSEDAEDGSFYNTPKMGAYASRFFGNLDLFVSGIYQYDSMALAGTGLSYNFFDYILYVEAGIEIDDNYVYFDGPSPSYDNSTDYLLGDYPVIASGGIERLIYFDNSTVSFIFEYLYSEASYTKRQTENFNPLVLPENYSVPGFGQHHIVLNAGIELIDLLMFDNAALFNLSDNSMYHMHSITLTTFEDIDIKCSVSFYHGGETTELGFMTPDFSVDYKIAFHF